MKFHRPLAALMALVLATTAAPAEQEPLDAGAMNELDALGGGFIVWERSVDGDWQIWTRPLAGNGEEKRLVPPEEERQHFCPKLSPDGTKLAYLSYRGRTDAYSEKSAFLYVMDIATGKQTRLTNKAISYHEDRAVVWFDDERLCYMEADGNTIEADLKTGKTTALTKDKARHYGWLINPSKTHATMGKPEFANFNAKTGAIKERAMQGGCQPYFTQDGKWGFWMNGAGGPIAKMFLPTRDVSPMIQMGDKRLPKARGYLYFPMISPCQRFLAFAASPFDHDHFTADYDIFVSRIDPVTLDLIGKPVRYTNFKGCDRFPDVWCAPLPLGSHFVEGATKLTLEPPIEKTMHWQVDGANVADGRTLEHLFESPGDHTVFAWNGTKKFNGIVHVRVPKPPVLDHVRRVNETTLELTFDEAISLSAARATAGSTALTFQGLDDDDRTAILRIPAGLKDLREVMISGIRDTAQSPNTLPPTRADLSTTTWPVTRDGLVFAWENKKTSAEGEQPKPSGKAFWSHDGGMDVRGGFYELPGAGEAMLGACGKSGAFTIEGIFKPQVVPFDKNPHPILSLEDGRGECQLVLFQQTSRLFLRVATDATGSLSKQQALCGFTTGQNYHVVISYAEGKVTLTVNGAEMSVDSKLTGRATFSAGKGTLRIGASGKYEFPWPGMVDQLSIYSRVLTASEVQSLFSIADKKLTERAGIKPKLVTARLIKASREPTLAEVKPYTEGLVKNEYEVLPKEETDQKQDFPIGTRLTISHWVWVNGQRAVAQPAEVGKTYRIVVEPLDAHSEIKPLVRKSDIDDDFSAEEYLDISNW